MCKMHIFFADLSIVVTALFYNLSDTCAYQLISYAYMYQLINPAYQHQLRLSASDAQAVFRKLQVAFFVLN